MNGPHDMGGMQCYGPIEAEQDEPVFHEEWEEKALALTLAVGFCGMWNLDISRQTRENLASDFYLSHSYYQLWLAGLENLMLERGMVTAEELEDGRLRSEAVRVNRTLKASETKTALLKGGPVNRDPNSEAVYKIGDKVRTRKFNPKGHTRLPRYARAAVGKIMGIHGYHVFPDSNAAGKGEDPQWLYNVAFEASELFGENADANSSVMIDCWEPYLERV